jgi:hypothetical protein
MGSIYEKMRYCAVCGRKLGVIADWYYDARDDCGSNSCQRIAANRRIDEKALSAYQNTGVDYTP